MMTMLACTFQCNIRFLKFLKGTSQKGTSTPKKEQVPPKGNKLFNLSQKSGVAFLTSEAEVGYCSIKQVKNLAQSILSLSIFSLRDWKVALHSSSTLTYQTPINSSSFPNISFCVAILCAMLASPLFAPSRYDMMLFTSLEKYIFLASKPLWVTVGDSLFLLSYFII